jgi:hypothetical protein
LGDDGYEKLREVVRKALKEALLYGNGILEVGWLYKEIQRFIYGAKFVPETATTYAQTGEPIQVPTGKTKRVVVKQPTTQRVNQPLVKHIHIRDFFIDPQASSPNIQSARFCATRSMPSIADLEQYRGQEGFTIPPPDMLRALAASKPSTVADQGKQASANYASTQYSPTNDYTNEATEKRVELIIYWTRERCVWMLNRKVVILNRCNDYGFLTVP